jgi:hypothetical protein
MAQPFPGVALICGRLVTLHKRHSPAPIRPAPKQLPPQHRIGASVQDAQQVPQLIELGLDRRRRAVVSQREAGMPQGAPRAPRGHLSCERMLTKRAPPRAPRRPRRGRGARVCPPPARRSSGDGLAEAVPRKPPLAPEAPGPTRHRSARARHVSGLPGAEPPPPPRDASPSVRHPGRGRLRSALDRPPSRARGWLRGGVGAYA